MPEYEVVRKIGLRTLLKVACRGGALYLHLPKDLVDNYGILGKDVVEVSLGEVRRRKR